MRTTFSRFDKGAFLKIHCYTIVIRSYLIVDRSQIFFYNFRGLLSKLLRYAIIWFLIFNCGPTAYTGASLILEKLFSRNSFNDIASFSIIASGPHLDATVTSENILRRSSIGSIIFNCRTLIWMLLLL